MDKPRITIVAAHGRNREIGVKNRLPWHIPSEFRHFKQLTVGHTVLMGSKTAISICGALPKRQCLVLTHQDTSPIPGFEVVHSLEEAIAKTSGDQLIIAGGQSVYELAMPYTDDMYISYIAKDYPEADAFFPEIDTEIFSHRWTKVHISPDEQTPLWAVRYFARRDSN